MRRKWDELASTIQGYEPQPYVWPTDISPEVHLELKRLEIIDRWLLQVLKIIIFSPLADDEKENRLRFVLAERGILITNTNLDYTLNPHSPANQACLKIAEFIAKKDEAVCHLLMPSIKKIIGTSPTPEDLQAASTDIEERFILTNFLISADGQALIALEDIIEHSANDTHLFFANDKHKNSMLYLTSQDRARVHRINKRYFDQLEEIHRIKQGEKPSIGWALNELKITLLRASVAGAGAETAVNISECREPVFAFYRLWKNIPLAIKNKIKDYTVNGGTYTLESYLLRLFMTLKEDASDIHITEAEYRRVIHEDIFPCAHQIGQSLGSLLAHNPNLMTIPLPGREADFHTMHLPNKETLTQLQKQTIEGLARRSAILSQNNHSIISRQLMLSVLFTNLGSNRYVLRENITHLYSLIKNSADLIDALVLIPQSEWNFFLLGVKSKKIKVFQTLEAQHTYLTILNALPVGDWATFFNALEYASLTGTLSGDQLAAILNGLSSLQWNDFKKAAGDFVSRILKNPYEIAYFFMSTSTTVWKSLYQTFKPFIEAIIGDAANMGQLFAETSKTYWSNLRDTVGLPFQTMLQNPRALKQFLLELSENDRYYFIANISGFNENTPITAYFIRALFETLNISAMRMVIAQLNQERVKIFFTSGKNMALLLQQFPYTAWTSIDKLFPASPTTNFYAELFENTPMDCWYNLAHFYKFELNLLHVFNPSLFSDLLTMIEPSLRPTLFHILIPNFSLYALNPKTFSELFKVFNPKDWLLIAKLLKNHMTICLNLPAQVLSFFNAFESGDRKKIAPVMIRIILNINACDPTCVSSWQNTYQAFSEKINQFSAEPIHMAFLFYSMPAKNWADLSWIMRLQLQTQLRDTDFLNAFLSIFQPSERLQLFNALDFCLNQVTANTMAVIFKLFPRDTWPQIATKLCHNKIRTPFFQSIGELGEFLNQFDTDALPIVYTLFQKMIDPLFQLPHTLSALSRTITLSTWQTLLPLLPFHGEMYQPSIPLATPRYEAPSNPGFFRVTQQRYPHFTDPANEAPRNDRR